MMHKFVLGFLIYVALYHVAVTYFSFGTGWVPPYGFLLLRDAGWLMAVGVILLYHRTAIKSYLQQRGYMWLTFLGLLAISILTSVILNVDVRHMAVGIKYTVYYMLPFLTAIYVGFVWHKTYDSKTFDRRVQLVWKVLVCVLIVGWVWQMTKNIWPEFFMWFGYGGLGDYVFGAKPPLYYLTGPRGVERRSGIFSGPNNYGYLLVVFFGFYWYGIRTYIKQHSLKVLLWGLYISTLLATLSRGAIIGVLIQIVLISYVIYQTKRRIIFYAIGAGLALVGALSALKWQSTVAHLQLKMQSLQYVQQAPRGYGLGSSGPSIHSQGGYLPENFFIQLMMDLGLHGFIIWAFFWLMSFSIIRHIYTSKPHARSLVFFLTVGFVGIMIEGLFLHVLEDSMVNYLYFIVWGIAIGYVGCESKTP